MAEKDKNTSAKISDQERATAALEYHESPKPGKFEIMPTKPLVTKEDLSLAYTPGVADVCLAIKENPELANRYTVRSNLVAVVSNGTAVLGLGNIGPLAGKPVMEGKAVLFKKFADIDVFDIEVDETDPKKFVDIVAALEPTFGGINLEDIKAPECFEIEQELTKRMDIPVFHDDQHGTAIVLTAAFMNSLRITKKKKEDIKVVCVGAGAAGVACMRMLVAYGVNIKNITFIDRSGVIHADRDNVHPVVEDFAHKTDARTLDDVIDGADLFVGLSAGGVLTKEMVAKMAENPVIFAMANPTPEITPEEVATVRDDAIMGTGRSDYPNQINNALCFPYIFRGALDVGAKGINDEMKLAAAEALADLAHKSTDALLDHAYKNEVFNFGKDYLIPKPFDPRLVSEIAPAVAKAAMDSGVAQRPISDLSGYKTSLKSKIDQSFSILRQVYNSAIENPKRVVFPDGEEARVVRAAQAMVNEGIGHPILIGKPELVNRHIDRHGLTMEEGKDYTLVNPQTYERIPQYIKTYYELRKRDGVSLTEAGIIMRYRWAALAAMMVREGDADAMLGGVTGKFVKFLTQARQVIGLKEGVTSTYALQLLLRKGQVYFIGDTNVNTDPTAEQVAEMTMLSAEAVRRFGIDPRVALISHSHFGSIKCPSATKMRDALTIIEQKDPDMIVEGEMQADAAVNMDILLQTFPDSRLREPANVLMMPNMAAANISFNLLRGVASRTEHIGPILLGMQKPVHILSIYSSVRQIVNMAALAVAEAQSEEESNLESQRAS